MFVPEYLCLCVCIWGAWAFLGAGECACGDMGHKMKCYSLFFLVRTESVSAGELDESWWTAGWIDKEREEEERGEELEGLDDDDGNSLLSSYDPVEVVRTSTRDFRNSKFKY